MENWDDLRIFLAVLRHGSHARAGRDLRVNATTVGRRLSALEAELATTLFDRTPSGLVPTPAGRTLGRHAGRIEGELFASERELRGRDSRLEGTVCITAGDAITTFLLVPWLLEFRRANPGIALVLRAEKAALDMARREADVAVRLSRPIETSLVATRAGSLPFRVFGSEAYFLRRERPRTMKDLAGHDWVGWDAELASAPQSQWLARYVPVQNVCVRSNASTALVAACALGYGLSVLPTFVATADPRLTPVPVPVVPPSREVWLVIHANSRRNARVRATMAWLAARFRG